LSDLAAPFGIAGITVDGMDVVAVRDAAQRMAAHARSGAGPAFLECLSHLFTPHSTATRDTRPAAELAALTELCPLRRYADRLRDQGLLDPETQMALEAEAETRVEAAYLFADASPFPEVSEVLRDVG
jgi:pyruvate dehydrogenase E1 component alpha subunit